MTPQKILALQNFVGIFQKFLDFFSSNSEKNIIFRSRFSQKILLNDYDFWQFSTNPWYIYLTHFSCPFRGRQNEGRPLANDNPEGRYVRKWL